LTILRAHALGALVFAGGSDIATLLDKTRAADPERDDLGEVLRMLEGIGATYPMRTGEIIREVEKKRTGGVNSPDRPADEWHDLLCRLGRDGNPNPKRLGRYLTKNARRIMGGLQLVSEIDTHAKVSRYHVRPVRNGRSAGSAGFCGVSGNCSSYAHENGQSHNDLCGDLSRHGAARPSETSQNPANPASASNGADGICAQCRDPILPSDGFIATASGLLHNRCADEWAAARPGARHPVQ
jgi:hypothetical protein